MKDCFVIVFYCRVDNTSKYSFSIVGESYCIIRVYTPAICCVYSLGLTVDFQNKH